MGHNYINDQSKTFSVVSLKVNILVQCVAKLSTIICIYILKVPLKLIAVVLVQVSFQNSKLNV